MCFVQTETNALQRHIVPVIDVIRRLLFAKKCFQVNLVITKVELTFLLMVGRIQISSFPVSFCLRLSLVIRCLCRNEQHRIP